MPTPRQRKVADLVMRSLRERDKVCRGFHGRSLQANPKDAPVELSESSHDVFFHESPLCVFVL